MSNAAQNSRRWAQSAEATDSLGCLGTTTRCIDRRCHNCRSVDHSIRMAMMWAHVAQAEALNNTEEFDGTEDVFGGEPPMFS